MVSRKSLNRIAFEPRARSRESDFQSYAKMIVTAWETEDCQTYFNLTFTHSNTHSSPGAAPEEACARSTILDAAERQTIMPLNRPFQSATSSGSNTPSYRVSPVAVMMSDSPFPPMGPPAKSPMAGAPSTLQKLTMMKDALLDFKAVPVIAMWKDGSLIFANASARKLLPKDVDADKVAAIDLLPLWTVYNEDFTGALDPGTHPISEILRSGTVTERRVGMYDQEGIRHVFDVIGEPVRDEKTGELFAGVAMFQDVTRDTQMITQIREQDEERFKLICDTMPQLVWTTRPDGHFDFFNGRWYDYTGLSKGESLRLGLTHTFHPHDRPEALRRWQHSLDTGEPYVSEHRCRSKDGEWRWFLGRALPQRNKATGAIEKWFGKTAKVGPPRWLS